MRSPLSHCYYPAYALQVDLATFDNHVGVATNYFKVVRNWKLIQELNRKELKSSFLKAKNGTVRVTTIGRHVMVLFLNKDQKGSYMILYRHKKGLDIRNFLQNIEGVSPMELMTTFKNHMDLIRDDDKIKVDFVVQAA